MLHDPLVQHPKCTRRHALQAGAIGLLGLGMNHLQALRAVAQTGTPRARAAIYIFLSGGLAQHDSFDPKPDAPDGIRGEFRSIATRTPGARICEHLPLLAQRSERWALVRSLTHPHHEHWEGTFTMLSGRTELTPGTREANKPRGVDWPSIAAVAGYATRRRNNLPPAVVLPERLIHNTGPVFAGQFAGLMGQRHDPWFLDASPFNRTTYGAYPEYEFQHNSLTKVHREGLAFQAPNLTLPEGLTTTRLGGRVNLLKHVEQQQRALHRAASAGRFDHGRQEAIALLTEARIQRLFDVVNAEPRELDRYGRNSFGWSLLLARRLVEAGVNLVQVNLGNDDTWDTHVNAFPHLKDCLLPPTDRAVSALLDDLDGRGLLESTLVVMAGEFGRTPHVYGDNKQHLPGRNHWGHVQTVFCAGGGVKGGTISGNSDKHGAFPASSPQRPENLAATIYHSLGIPQTAVWKDELDRPYHIYDGEPIFGLT